MKIAVVSGKGGTGKTTVSLSLASYLAENHTQVTYVDCDVEEPNGHLFLHPSIEHTKTVGIPIPVVDSALCDGCGKCGEICRFSAIVVITSKVLIFPELCKGCGGCSLVCPQKAIQESPQEVGIVERGSANGIGYLAGKLKIGQASAVPIIRDIKRTLPDGGTVILDAPPGTSCPVIETGKDCDFVVLVTEPTPFGLHDLILASEMVEQIGIPQGIVLNRASWNNELIYKFCQKKHVDLIAEIPDDRRIATAYSRGEILIDTLPEYKVQFADILHKIEHRVQQMNILKNS
ncbi:(4Fe-4S)-binding protein [bacterium SM23_57]|nr:MAG: (4Fe-4S)-binding protein [bacterium SM23_57]